MLRLVATVLLLVSLAPAIGELLATPEGHCPESAAAEGTTDPCSAFHLCRCCAVTPAVTAETVQAPESYPFIERPSALRDGVAVSLLRPPR